jgi:WD40 repeat protein
VLTSLRGGRELQRLRIHSGFSRQYYAAAFTSLGTAVLLAGEAGELILYDLESSSIVRRFIGHSDFTNVNDVALAPSGRRFASCSNDKTLKVWNLESPSAIATFTCDAAVHCCAFLNEHEIMAGDGLGHVHFLRVNDREP